MENDILSLKHQLVNWLFTPIFLLLLFTMSVGYVAAVKLSDHPYDLVLVERARLVASQFDRAAMPDAAALVRGVAPGLYFSLYDEWGDLVAANAELPKPRPVDLAGQGPRLRDSYYLGNKVRLLTLRFQTRHRDPNSEFVLLAAERVEERIGLSRSILGYIVIPQFLFIIVAGLAVWLGLKKGFEPVERLRRAVARRRGDDLSPLDENQAPSEVRPLIREMNLHIERHKALLEQQKRFVANAAHQLRTPFAGLKAQAELAKRVEAPPEVRTALAGICEGAGRCSHLVSQLLTLARNEPGAQVGDSQRMLDLERIVQEAAMHWAPEALRKNIDLGFEGTASRLPVRGNEAALRDLIDNLFDNAIRYTPEGGRVTARTDFAQGAWLSVEDSGPGIPAELRGRVFDRFYRIEGSGQPGTGLGLAIVLEVAQSHRAGVAIEAGDDGKGSVFVVRFPHHGAEG